MTSYEKPIFDVEYGKEDRHHSIIPPDESGAVHGESFVAGNTLYYKLQRFAGRFGVEQRGIERVPADERTDTSTMKVGTMVWILQNMELSPNLTSNSGAQPTWLSHHFPLELLLCLFSASVSSIHSSRSSSSIFWEPYPWPFSPHSAQGSECDR